MITKLTLDSIDMQAHLKYVKNPTLYRAGTPVRFLEFCEGSKYVLVALPDGKQIVVEAAHVGSGLNCPEESLPFLANETGIPYDTLVKAAQQRRILARKSGKGWITTLHAIEHAQATGKLKPRK